MPGRVTMTDVAREAGCSQTTVSVVLNGNRDIHISPDTRRRVIEAVAALGYRRPASRQRPMAPARLRRSALSNEAKRPVADSRSRTTRVAHALGRRIIAGQYQEGSTLPGEAELMSEFRVSRTVLREAMKILAGKGLLHAKTRIGTRVLARSAWQLFDADLLTWHAEMGFNAEFLAALGEMRLLIEPGAAALAALRHEPEDIVTLEGWVGRMSAAATSRRDFVDADLHFHLEIARLAANPFLSALSTLIEVALVGALTRSSPTDEPNGVATSAQEHRAIVEAIASADADRARITMRRVIEEGIRRSATP
jgi:DNA-binding FadR family transcriptional regulator